MRPGFSMWTRIFSFFNCQWLGWCVEASGRAGAGTVGIDHYPPPSSHFFHVIDYAGHDSISQPSVQCRMVLWLSAPCWNANAGGRHPFSVWALRHWAYTLPCLHLPLNCNHVDEGDTLSDSKATRWTEPGSLNDHVEQSSLSPWTPHEKTLEKD